MTKKTETMHQSFSVIFWIKRGKADKTGKAPIYARVTINRERAEISTGQKIESDRWNVNTGSVRGNKEDARTINMVLSNVRNKVKAIYYDLTEHQRIVTAEVVKNTFLGKGSLEYSLLQIFQQHNEDMRAQVGKEYATGTLERYQTSLKLTKEFLKHKYNRDDIYFSELQYSFITDYEFFLKTVRGNSHNTASKYLRNFKKIIRIAVVNGWLDRDPFLAYKCSLREVKRDYLTQDELDRIMAKRFSSERLTHVRDVFVFCCYTGLAYADVFKLSSSDISRGIDGEYWLFTARRKTGVSSNVPLLSPALEILEKYEDYAEVMNGKQLLPVITNQKLNAYLKEIADVCGINKKLTFHIARHTFATTVTLTNGVPIESVSSMLGHKNLRTTQIYAKVVEKKVSADMKALKNKMESKKRPYSNEAL
ncbi:site-specific integrase [Tunicatimonas pelagia]|uniref:site-specific integrase n=1 Tax=Tunicatimonas pelagia TaxID=931531 RepID=UPI002666FDB9|nr:site-specific integrase [Tunicatimonas pelagia]WKN44295.1 site-specific integrase [Tunicatimonas pelagia]